MRFFSLQQSEIKNMITTNDTRNGVPLCDDGHFTPYEQYVTMLKDEQYQFLKIMKIIDQEPTADSDLDKNVLNEIDVTKIKKEQKKRQQNGSC